MGLRGWVAAAWSRTPAGRRAPWGSRGRGCWQRWRDTGKGEGKGKGDGMESRGRRENKSKHFQEEQCFMVEVQELKASQTKWWNKKPLLPAMLHTA